MLLTVKREARHVGCVTLYLLFCCSVFSMLKKLTLATYQIEWSALLPTVTGTLALAKVVVVLDHIPVASRIDARHPIWLAHCTRRSSIAPLQPLCCTRKMFGPAYQSDDHSQ